MTLWIVFPVVALALFGAVTWLLALIAARGPEAVEARSESGAWWRLVAPPFAGGLAVAFTAGWALQEPDPADEWITVQLGVLALIVAAVAVRAIVRASRSLRAASDPGEGVVTVGLLRCRTLVAPAFERVAEPVVLAAALAHERAHARARDPLRIWAAQLAADLQWPLPHTRQRLRRWQLALEMRRDDEALAAGASPLALAESILLAARLHGGHGVGASITGSGDGIALRVRRLLAQRGTPPCPAVPRWRAAGPCVSLAIAAMFGTIYGEALIRLVPGVAQ